MSQQKLSFFEHSENHMQKNAYPGEGGWGVVETNPHLPHEEVDRCSYTRKQEAASQPCDRDVKITR